jgi:hypothetical protein
MGEAELVKLATASAADTEATSFGTGSDRRPRPAGPTQELDEATLEKLLRVERQGKAQRVAVKPKWASSWSVNEFQDRARTEAVVPLTQPTDDEDRAMTDEVVPLTKPIDLSPTIEIVQTADVSPGETEAAAPRDDARQRRKRERIAAITKPPASRKR